MVAAHFAAGMGIKGRVPNAPTWGLLVGAIFLDILNPPLMIAGMDREGVLEWSHSLAMSLVWSVLLGALFLAKSWSVAVAIGGAVFSHFILDVIVHPPHLALWPHSPVHLGLDLWRSWPRSWWFVESVVVAAGILYYWKRSREVRTFGKRVWLLAACVLIVHILNSPWLLGATR